MTPQRSITVLCTLLVVLAGISPDSAAQVHFTHPQPGDIYQEFVRTLSIGSDEWRVTDPNINLGLYPQAAGFLPNPTLDIYVGDLSGATRAEAVITLWGGHIGTTGKKIRFNGNNWITIPELNSDNGIPGGSSGECYINQVNVVVDVPLSDLQVGTNTFTGTNTGQTCYGFQWGQHGWYGVMLRVYYGSGKTHPTGSITSPANNAIIGDTPVIQVSTSGSVSQVEILGYYDGYDTDGDGVFLEYHGDYHRGPSDEMALRNHIGTRFSGSPSLVWDNSWVPDQSGIKLIARIKGDNDVWFVTDEVSNILLARSSSSVRMYKPPTLSERAWARGDLPPVEVDFSIPSGDNIGSAVQAAYHVRTWNGEDAAREPGEGHYRRVNSEYVYGWSASDFGENHYYDYDVEPISVSALNSGTNTIGFWSETVAHHGIEILWPGPAITARWGTPLPVQLASFTWKRVNTTNVLLEWKTLSEIKNFGFEVERAAGSPTNFSTLPNSFQPGHGTTTVEHFYSFTDAQPLPGISYYRLRQVDTDGAVHYTDPLRVDVTTGVAETELPTSFGLSQNHPNPFNPSTVIEFTVSEQRYVSLRLYNALGQEVRTLVSEVRAPGRYAVTLDATGLGSGTYFYRMESGSFVSSRRMVLLK